MESRLAPVALTLLIGCSIIPVGGQSPYPPAEDRGTAGVLQAIGKLPVYAHVLYTIAHPDDESAGTLTWLARKAHARTALFSLTRGDGGQNILGTEKEEAMGLVRTGELLEACRLYGVEPYFATVFEFGFSKSAEETFTKWGKEQTLEEVVRFIRRWRPVVIISAFGGGAGDGHGHHQAAGILTAEAFRAAGDPSRFPEHLRRGLAPWQAKSLYRRDRSGSVSVPVGNHDPVLGRSYLEIGVEGYGKHRSQGNGGRFAPPGAAYDRYTLADTVLAGPQGGGFYDSVDISLLSITELAGEEISKTDGLKLQLEALQRSALEAAALFQPEHPEKAAPALAAGLETIRRAVTAVFSSTISQARKRILEEALAEKRRDFEDALHATLGISLSALADARTVVPGEKVRISGQLVNRGPEQVVLHGVGIGTPDKWEASDTGAGDLAGISVPPGKAAPLDWNVTVPATAPATEPFWYRVHPGDNRYLIRTTRDPFAAFDAPLITLRTAYVYRDTRATIEQPVRALSSDPIRGVDMVDFQVVPAVSVGITPSPAIVPLSPQSQLREFRVTVRSDKRDAARGIVRLRLPSGWSAEPAQADFNLERKAETASLRFKVRIPGRANAGQEVVEAVASLGNDEFTRGYRIVSYPGNWTRHLYAPARAEVRVFDLHVPPQLSVAYVPGAGDEVAEALEQLGTRVHVLSSEELAERDLAGFSAVVTGIRAFNVNTALRANNSRLVRYVENGGTLIVQYCRPEGGNGFSFAPYPMTLSNSLRITVEDAPVRILQPEHSVFRIPNRITAADFEGWVQERGLYFASKWDPRYTPLMSGADPGEPDLPGGMLIAAYGKGFYIYTAYAWFRQLPAGVPGAYRILANMLALGFPHRSPDNPVR